MIAGDVEFHNTAETELLAGGGLRLHRFPREVRAALSPLGRMVAAESAGCEIRFVTGADSVRVDLSVIPGGLDLPATVAVFKGGFLHSTHTLRPGTPNSLVLTDINSEMAGRFLALEPAVRDTEYFDHRVWRIQIGRFSAVFHGVDGYGDSIRPPLASEVPAHRWLAYGSSITHGASPNLHHLAYIYQAARLMKWDVFNLGLSGSCRLEPEVARFIANQTDWDSALLELGVNLRRSLSPDEFQDRVETFLDILLQARPDNPLYLVTLFPNGNSRGVAANPDPVQETQCAFDDILRELPGRFSGSPIHLVEGADLLTRADQLSPDLIHPSDYGHIEMGVRLADRIRSLATP